jgi:hypothetical protein
MSLPSVTTITMVSEPSIPTSENITASSSIPTAESTERDRRIDFYPPYSSGGIGINFFAQWSYKDWGASAVISGHDHDYERLNVGGLPYFVDGTGGAPIQPFATPVSGSQVRYSGDYKLLHHRPR